MHAPGQGGYRCALPTWTTAVGFGVFTWNAPGYFTTFTGGIFQVPSKNASLGQ